MSDDISEIKKLLKTDKLIIGKEATIKRLRKGDLAKVYLAKNCPAEVKENITHYTDLAKVELAEVDAANDELGDVCKKQFSISVIGIQKE